MSHFTTSYKDLPEDKAITKAVSDTKNFIGSGKKWDKFYAIVTAAIVTGASMSTIHTMCSFVGVQGYPVIAMCKYITKILQIDMPTDEEVIDAEDITA